MDRIRLLTLDDVPAGLALKTQARWNQVEADWRRLIELQPDGVFAAECDGWVVGTVTTCVFGPVAWIAMMLVEESQRGRGIGRRLMNHALEFLEIRGVDTVRLDATRMGRPLYESLGFRADGELLRYRGMCGESGSRTLAPDLNPLSRVGDLDSLLALDRLATDTDRSRLIGRLLCESPESSLIVRDEDRLSGFVLWREGALACQIGPCIAIGSVGGSLLDAALSRLAGKVAVFDVPESHLEARGLAESRGFAVSRRLTRMTRGPRVEERMDRIWASAGPEKG